MVLQDERVGVEPALGEDLSDERRDLILELHDGAAEDGELRRKPVGVRRIAVSVEEVFYAGADDLVARAVHDFHGRLLEEVADALRERVVVHDVGHEAGLEAHAAGDLYLGLALQIGRA